MGKSEKRSRKCIDIKTKKQLIAEVQKGKTKKEIATQFGIRYSTLYTIYENRDKILKFNVTEKSYVSYPRSVELDKEMLKYVYTCAEKNIPVNGPLLRREATTIALKIGYDNFKASRGWLTCFKRRNGLSSLKRVGKAAKVDDVTCRDWQNDSKALIESHAPRDIFKLDQTVSFFKALPDTTLAAEVPMDRKVLKPIHYTRSRYGRKRKINTPTDCYVLDKKGQYVNPEEQQDYEASNDGQVVCDPFSSNSVDVSQEPNIFDAESIRDDTSNEENIPREIDLDLESLNYSNDLIYDSDNSDVITYEDTSSTRSVGPIVPQNEKRETMTSVVDSTKMKNTQNTPGLHSPKMKVNQNIPALMKNTQNMLLSSDKLKDAQDTHSLSLVKVKNIKDTGSGTSFVKMTHCSHTDPSVLLDRNIVAKFNKEMAADSTDKVDTRVHDAAEDIEDTYVPGDLVWARMNLTAPFWPALITCNLMDDKYVKTIALTHTLTNQYHATFYGSKALSTSAWIKESNMLPYKGSQCLVYNEEKYSKRLLNKSYIITCISETALLEADTALTLNRNERLNNLETRNRTILAEQQRKKKERKERRKERAREFARARSLVLQNEKEVNTPVKNGTKSLPSSPNNYAQNAATPSHTLASDPVLQAITGSDETCSVTCNSEKQMTSTSQVQTTGVKRKLEDSKEAQGSVKKIKNSTPHFKGIKIEEFLRYMKSMEPELKKEFPNYSDEEIQAIGVKKWNESKKSGELNKKVTKKKRRFIGVSNIKVCEICFEGGKLVMCQHCKRPLHMTCGRKQKGIEFVCLQCRKNTKPCSCCDEQTYDVISCSVKKCPKKYHLKCINSLKWQQAKQIPDNKVKCPDHTCHTCVADDTNHKTLHVPADQLIHCVVCPTAYHTNDLCIPAAAYILSSSQCICPKHLEQLGKRPIPGISSNWCMVCMKGGVLIVCETCPVTYHPECIKEKSVANAETHCPECLSGNFPVCGQVVWAKHGNYRWWPSRIVFPDEVPHLYDQRHLHNRNEFIIQFLGSRDYAWTNNKRVFPYIFEDTKREQRQKLTQQAFQVKFKLGLEEADAALRDFKAARDQFRNNANTAPPPYQRIRNNRIHNNSVRAKMQELTKNLVHSGDKCICFRQASTCGFGTGCWNRDLCLECDPDCPVGDNCCNQMFTKRQYAMVQPMLTSRCGWGLFTKQDLKEGDFVIEYVGDVVDESELQARVQAMQQRNDRNYYFLAIEGQLYLDAGPRGNEARFMNHSCAPNCKADKWLVKGEIRMGLFALKDITKDSELTFDYNLQQFGDRTQECLCGAENCTGFIGNTKSKTKSLMSKKVISEQVQRKKPTKSVKPKKKMKCDREVEDTASVSTKSAASNATFMNMSTEHGPSTSSSKTCSDKRNTRFQHEVTYSLTTKSAISDATRTSKGNSRTSEPVASTSGTTPQKHQPIPLRKESSLHGVASNASRTVVKTKTDKSELVTVPSEFAVSSVFVASPTDKLDAYEPIAFTPDKIRLETKSPSMLTTLAEKRFTNGETQNSKHKKCAVKQYTSVETVQSTNSPRTRQGAKALSRKLHFTESNRNNAQACINESAVIVIDDDDDEIQEKYIA